MLQACYPTPPPWDGDSLADDVYGGAVAQGNLIPGLFVWVGRVAFSNVQLYVNVVIVRTCKNLD